MLLEDGTYVVTDESGKYHIEGVNPGTHVVQVDLASIPETTNVIGCGNDTQHAGTAFSQFVDVQGGTMWRADFYVRERAPLKSLVALRLDASMHAPSAEFAGAPFIRADAARDDHRRAGWRRVVG